MNRSSASVLVALLAILGCSDDSSTGVSPSDYTLETTTPSLSIAQDSAMTLTIDVKRAGTDTTIKGSRLEYTSADYNIATVNGTGVVTAIRGGSTTITAKLGDARLDVPVTVRARPATSVELTLLTGPAGGLKSVRADTGTFYALPADPISSQLRATVLIGLDTVFCNVCPTRPTGTPPRVQRQVRFVSLDTSIATIGNAGDPTLQASTDTSGRIIAKDTTSTGVRFVLEIPADGIADTVLVKFSLRPIDSLGLRPDSAFFPTTNGTGLQKQVYPNSDATQALVRQASTTNFVVGIDFLSRVQNPPNATTGAAGTVRFIPSRTYGPVTVFRPSVPNVTWESANRDYLDINAAGSVTGKCAFIGGNCPTTGSTVLNCNASAGTMPAVFLGNGNYTIPSCSPAKTIPMPGAFCTTTSTTDLTSICTIWVRASATDQVTGRLLQSKYRVNIGR
jgi:hypothetical protein